MADRSVKVPEELLADLEKVARAQNLTVDEILAEVLKRYLRDKQWASLKSYGRAKAKERGLTEEDVDIAIAETRNIPSR